jgi:hypothetical protein
MSAKLGNNSNESGLLIYNKIEKASSTTVASYMFKFAAQNNFTHKHNPFGRYYMTEDMNIERKFLKHHYDYPNKPFSTDQHIVFVNAVEDYGFEEHERPNWINVVRPPIERLVSLFYFFKEKKETPMQSLAKILKDLTGKSNNQIHKELKSINKNKEDEKEMKKDKKNLVRKIIRTNSKVLALNIFALISFRYGTMPAISCFLKNYNRS